MHGLLYYCNLLLLWWDVTYCWDLWAWMRIDSRESTNIVMLFGSWLDASYLLLDLTFLSKFHFVLFAFLFNVYLCSCCYVFVEFLYFYGIQANFNNFLLVDVWVLRENISLYLCQLGITSVANNGIVIYGSWLLSHIPSLFSHQVTF